MFQLFDSIIILYLLGYVELRPIDFGRIEITSLFRSFQAIPALY